MELKRQPTFLCIGVQKAGTSWLYEMLRQHPEICTGRPKEIHFFNRDKNFQRGWDWYLSHFAHCYEAKAIGEFTPDYLWDVAHRLDVPGYEVAENIPARVHKALPDIKLLVILRNPVDRAVSSYFHEIGANRLSPNRRLSQVGDSAGIVSKGYYSEHLGRWLEYYPRERFKIMIYEEDLARDRRSETLRSVFDHIGVDRNFRVSEPDRKYNKRRSHFDYRLSRLPGRLQELLREHTPEWIENSPYWEIPIADDELTSLRHHYQRKNSPLESLLGRALPW